MTRAGRRDSWPRTGVIGSEGDAGRGLTLVEAAGVTLDPGDLVMTSSSERLNKSDGLLARVIERAEATPAATLHIGDHATADVERAAAIMCVRCVPPSATSK